MHKAESHEANRDRAKLLLNATDLDIVQELVAVDATYVSLNYHNADLQAVRLNSHNTRVDNPQHPKHLTDCPVD